MAEDDLNLEGAGRPIAGRRRFSNASSADQRSFLKAFMDERTETWKAADGTVYKINRRGDIAGSFAASNEIVSKPTPAQKARATRMAKQNRDLAIRTNATKRAAGLTKAQRLTAQQEQLFASSDVAETDEQIQKRVQRGIKKQGGTMKSFVGLGLGVGGGGLGGSLDELFGLQMAENSGRGSGGGRMISRPRKAI